MTPEEFSRIRTIFDAVEGKSGHERRHELDRLCGGDDRLRREVERLLEASEHLPEWLTAPMSGRAPGFAANPDTAPMEGRQLGAYVIVRKLGVGGMGEVYLAERSDGLFQKHAAIKLVRSEMSAPEILKRFRREREILASLEHPHIARLLDAGATQEGYPYFVMEYVDGQPLLQWCDERKLNITQRLGLFADVCDAVQYAHQRLVIHRDLKPANILVSSEGAVKLLDFGIAKLVNPGPEAEGETPTLWRMMTPDYASPEQIRGERVTTLTDVYSLGVVLYQLLTGHRPYRLTHAVFHEIVRVVSQEEPLRPSTIIATTEEMIDADGKTQVVTPNDVSEVREGEPTDLHQRLRGDLDCILLMTLRKEPERRYASVEALKEDLDRHLAALPVRAHEDSWRYRFSRFAKRNPPVLVGGVLLLLTMLAGIGTTIWQARLVEPLPDSSRGASSLFAPQLAIFSYIVLVLLVACVYFTKARIRRVTGALTGGVVFAACWLLRWKVGIEMGWWHAGAAYASAPVVLDFSPLVAFALPAAGIIFELVLWRISRRFGARWLSFAILLISLWAVTRDRFWWDGVMGVMIAAPGVGPMLADAGMLGAGLAGGYGLMRLISGPSRKDRLARQKS